MFTQTTLQLWLLVWCYLFIQCGLWQKCYDITHYSVCINTNHLIRLNRWNWWNEIKIFFPNQIAADKFTHINTYFKSNGNCFFSFSSLFCLYTLLESLVANFCNNEILSVAHLFVHSFRCCFICVWIQFQYTF